MTDETYQSTNLHFTGHKACRGRRLGVAITLAIIIATCSFSYYVNSHSRYKIVGRTDQATGYSIAYTVSSRYRKSTDVQELEDKSTLEAYNFAPRQLPKAAQWLHDHVLRAINRTLYSGSAGWKPGAIAQHTYRGSDVAGFDTDNQGYPDLLFMRIFTTNMAQHHMLISGCHATWCEFNTPGTGAGKLRNYTLIVQPKDQALVYVFEGIDDRVEPTGVVGEMMKIRDSIRVEQVR